VSSRWLKSFNLASRLWRTVVVISSLAFRKRCHSSNLSFALREMASLLSLLLSDFFGASSPLWDPNAKIVKRRCVYYAWDAVHSATCKWLLCSFIVLRLLLLLIPPLRLLLGSRLATTTTATAQQEELCNPRRRNCDPQRARD